MDNRIVCIMGPTGAGKTAASLGLARAFDGEVVNADSRQVYRDFPIITAQPSPEEQAACPHRLYGFLGCREKITAGRFVDLAGDAAGEVLTAGRRPLLVGGTGLYLRALLQGLAPIPPVPDEIQTQLQDELADRGLAALHQELLQVDPPSGARIHPNDTQRILRALEVFRTTGRTLTWWHEQPTAPPRFRAFKIGVHVPLAELEPRLAQRIDMMLEAGALDEARAAMVRCPDPESPGWSGIGCAELHRHLCGEMSLDAAKELWLRNTRAYAKRQLTWFRKERDLHWFAPDDVDAMRDAAAAFLAAP